MGAEPRLSHSTRNPSDAGDDLRSSNGDDSTVVEEDGGAIGTTSLNSTVKPTSSISKLKAYVSSNNRGRRLRPRDEKVTPQHQTARSQQADLDAVPETMTATARDQKRSGSKHVPWMRRRSVVTTTTHSTRSEARELLTSGARELAMSLLAGFKESSGVFPPLAAAAGCALFIAETVDTFKSNMEKWQALRDYILSLTSKIGEKITNEDGYSQVLSAEIMELQGTLQDIQQRVTQLASRTPVLRFIQARGDPARIADFQAEIDRVVQHFTVQALVEIATGNQGRPRPPTPTPTYVDGERSTIQLRGNIANNSSAVGYFSSVVNGSAGCEFPMNPMMYRFPSNIDLIIEGNTTSNGSAAGLYTTVINYN